MKAFKLFFVSLAFFATSFASSCVDVHVSPKAEVAAIADTIAVDGTLVSLPVIDSTVNPVHVYNTRFESPSDAFIQANNTQVQDTQPKSPVPPLTHTLPVLGMAVFGGMRGKHPKFGNFLRKAANGVKNLGGLIPGFGGIAEKAGEFASKALGDQIDTTNQRTAGDDENGPTVGGPRPGANPDSNNPGAGQGAGQGAGATVKGYWDTYVNAWKTNTIVMVLCHAVPVIGFGYWWYTRKGGKKW